MQRLNENNQIIPTLVCVHDLLLEVRDLDITHFSLHFQIFNALRNVTVMDVHCLGWGGKFLMVINKMKSLKTIKRLYCQLYRPLFPKDPSFGSQIAHTNYGKHINAT